jgi:chromosome partitioning protein
VSTVYAIANQKGGVGKTTTAVNLCACVAKDGYRTLIVDLDPQANATVGLGLPRVKAPGVYEVLSGTVTVREALVETAVANLSLLPAGSGLAGASIELAREPGFERHLRDALVAVRDEFQYIVLDCPPSLGPLTVNALVAADCVIVPVQSEYFALEGLASLLETLGLIQRELNPDLRIGGMLITMHDDRTHLGRDVESEVRRHFPELVFETVIPRNVRIGEAPSHGVPVLEHDPDCAGAQAYTELARELVSQ